MPLDKDCVECNPEETTEDYTWNAPGSVCSSEHGDPTMMNTCDATGNCTHKVRGTCIIDGKSRPEGVSNPNNECEWCDPEKEPGGWSPKASGNHCADDDLPCTADVCDSSGKCGHEVMTGSCAINTECIGPGVKHPTDSCLVCDPEQNKTDYVTSDDKACRPCLSDSDCETGQTCENGECVDVPVPDCVVDDDCLPGFKCEAEKCVPVIEPDCVEDVDCPIGEVCGHGVCRKAPECDVENPCPPGYECKNEQCKQIPIPPGPECTDESDCANGDCVDGKCTAVVLRRRSVKSTANDHGGCPHNTGMVIDPAETTLVVRISRTISGMVITNTASGDR